MDFKVIEDFNKLKERREEIEILFSSSVCFNPHISYSWYSIYWDTYGKSNNLRFILALDNNRIVGCAPLMISEYRVLGIFRYKRMSFIGTGLSDFGDIISFNDDIHIKNAIISFILREVDWDELDLQNIPWESNTIQSLIQTNKNYYVKAKPQTRCLYIDLFKNTWDSYYKSLSRNHRGELRKRINKLDKLDSWKCEFNPIISPDQLFEIMKKIHTARSKQLGWREIFESKEFKDFFISLINFENREFKVNYSLLYVNDAPISFTLGFVSKNIYYHWMIGFDPQFEYLSPNKVHHQLLINECFNNKYQEFNFMRGDSKYKFKWTKYFRNNYRVKVLQLSGIKGKLNYFKILIEKRTSLFWRTVGSIVKKKWVTKIIKLVLKQKIR